MLKIQKKAGQLRALTAEADVFLVAAEAEDVLASSVETITAQFGISQRWALDRYVTDHYIEHLTAQLVAASKSYREAADAAEPVKLSGLPVRPCARRAWHDRQAGGPVRRDLPG